MQVTAKNYREEVIESEQPVLVDYYADWCGPCRALEPVIANLADKHGFKLVKVNIDEEQDLAQSAGVASIPFVTLVKNGEVEAFSVGAKPLARLEEALGLDEEN